jgi:hypothetical protein
MTMDTQMNTQSATPLPTPPSVTLDDLARWLQQIGRQVEELGTEIHCIHRRLDEHGERFTKLEGRMAVLESKPDPGTPGAGTSATGGTNGSSSTSGASSGGTSGSTSGGTKTNGSTGASGSGGSGGTVTGNNAVGELPTPVPPRADLSTRDYWTATIAFAAAYFAIPAARRRGIAHALPLIPAAVGVIDSLVTYKALDERALLPAGGAAAGGAAAIALAR